MRRNFLFLFSMKHLHLYAPTKIIKTYWNKAKILWIFFVLTTASERVYLFCFLAEEQETKHKFTSQMYVPVTCFTNNNLIPTNFSRVLIFAHSRKLAVSAPNLVKKKRVRNIYAKITTLEIYFFSRIRTDLGKGLWKRERYFFPRFQATTVNRIILQFI